jgi:hypothetical protein
MTYTNPAAMGSTGGGDHVTASHGLSIAGHASDHVASAPIIRMPQAKPFRGLRSAAQFARYLANANSIYAVQEQALAAIESGDDAQFFLSVNDFTRFEKYVLEGNLGERQ